jgi:hypothetical protein
LAIAPAVRRSVVMSPSQVLSFWRGGAATQS